MLPETGAGCPAPFELAEDLSCVRPGYWDDVAVTPGTLPATGSSNGELLLAALMFGGLGVALVLIARR